MVSEGNDGSGQWWHTWDRVGFHHSFCTFSLLFCFCFLLIFLCCCLKRCYRHAIVSDLAAFGAAVHTCSRTQTELKKCLEKWKSEGFQVTGSVCDVTSPQDREKLLEEVASTFNGKLNIYV